VLVVARLGLGTINHTLLTVEALFRREIPVLGVILNAVETPGPEAHATPELIADFVDCEVFGPLPHGATRPEQVAAHLEACHFVSQLLGD
jgi:dethiobiotin synthetase